jgi:peptidoglycan/xylan/chitin deacetylase (PgdA/CDA1 family)
VPAIRTSPRRPSGTTASTLAGLGLTGAALAYAAPAVAAVGPLRRAVLPRLAGVGAPDHVALTFDDGPRRLSTPRFLDLLARHRVRATFFVLGASLADDLPLGREILAGGHELAVHGWDHRLTLRRGATAIREDLRRAHGLVSDLGGQAPRWYRPPYGVASTPALRAAVELGMTPVLWTAWGRDWTRSATPGSVRRAVLHGPQAGGTVLLHDVDTCAAPGAWWATVGALPGLLRTWQQAGLRVGPLAEHGLRPC